MSNILETFYFLFDSDAKKLDKGLDDSTKKSKQLENSLQQTDKAAAQMGELFAKIGANIGAYFSIRTLVTTIGEVNEFVDTLGDASDALGVNVSDLHAWENAVRLSDGEAGDFTNSLKTINRGFSLLAATGKGELEPFLKQLGLNMKDVSAASKDPLTGLLKMSAAFEKLSASEAAGLGSKIGLDQGTVNLLRQGREGVELMIAKQKELGVITKEQKELFDKYNKQVIELDLSFQELKRQLVTNLIPALNWLLGAGKDVMKWMGENKTYVTIFAGVLTGVLLPALISVAIATWAWLLPYIAVGLAALAFAAILALVLDDIWAFEHGHDSAIGRAAAKWKWFASVVKFFDGQMWAALGTVQMVCRLMAQAFDLGPTAAIERLGAKFSEIASKLSGGAAGLFGDSFGGIGQLAGMGNSAVRQTSTPLSAQTSASLSNGVMRNNNKSVRIDALNVDARGGDSSEIGRNVSGAINKHLSGVNDEFDDGVKG